MQFHIIGLHGLQSQILADNQKVYGLYRTEKEMLSYSSG